MSSVCHRASVATGYMLQVFVTEIQVAISLRRFVLRRYAIMTVLKNQRPKVSKKLYKFSKSAWL